MTRIHLPSGNGAPNPIEAAAIVAAVERFVAETTPVPDPTTDASPWRRAALAEGVGAKAAFGPRDTPADPWV